GQDRDLAAVLRQAVHHVRAVGRGLPPVERQMAGRGAEERRVDQHAGYAVLLHEQLEVLRARRTLLEEQLAAGAAREARRRRLPRELLVALQKPVASRDGVEHRPRVLVLSLEEGQPLRI